MKNKLITLILSLVSLTTFAQIDTVPSISTTLTPSYVSNYMFRGQLIDASSFQPELDFGIGNLDFGLWSDTSTNSLFKQTELDLYSSFNYNVNDKLSINPGFTLYHYIGDSSDQYSTTFEPSITLNYTVRKVKFAPEVFYDTVLHAATLQLSSTYVAPIKLISSELDFTGTIGKYKINNDTNTPVKTEESGNYWSLGVAIPFKINDKLNLTVGYSFNKGVDGYIREGNKKQIANEDSVGRDVISTSLAYSF